MQTGAMVTLYRNTRCLTQSEAADDLGCGQATLSKWEKDGIPARSKDRVLSRIMPPVEKANLRSVSSTVNGSERHLVLLSPSWEILAISEPSAIYHGEPQRDIIGKNMLDVNAVPEMVPFAAEVFSRGIFRGLVLQAFLDGIPVDPERAGIEEHLAVCRVIPIGIEYEGRCGIICSFSPSVLKPVRLLTTIQDTF